jgi:hypothetical protein
MALSQIPDRGTHHPSAANSALAQVTLEALLMPNSNGRKKGVRVVRAERQEELDHDTLGTSRGIINGLRLSVTLWSFIALVVILMR